MFKIELDIYDNDWDEVKSNTNVYNDELRAILTIIERPSETEAKMLVYVNELYNKLLQWIKDDQKNMFVDFYYIDPVEFEDYLEIKSSNGKYCIDLPTSIFYVDKTAAVQFGRDLVVAITSMFEKKGKEGIQYLNLLNTKGNK